MLQKIKSEFREIKKDDPGCRFINHYKRSRRKEGGRGTFWRSFGFIIAGLVLLICGLVLSLPPGFPGFLLWIPGIALLSARSIRLSILLDKLEAWGRRVWHRVSGYESGTDK